MTNNNNTKNITHILDAIKIVCGGEIPSLRAFASALDIPASRLHTHARKPIPGQIYDPNVINWDVVNNYLTIKLSSTGCRYASMEALVEAAKAEDEWLSENQATRCATGANLIDVDGHKMPKRKSPVFEMGSDEESLLCFKHDPNVYKMVYQTIGFTVIRAVNEDGSFAKEEVRVLSNSTLNTKCVVPRMLTAGIKERFRGEYTPEMP